MGNAFAAEDLAKFQSETLEYKRTRTQAKISEAYGRYNGKVLVSLSGGKDSTVLADQCGEWCRIIGIPLNMAFCNTGLEYPEIQTHVKTFAQYERDKYGIDVNLEILRPKMRFDEVISTYGYPMIGKEVAEAIYYARRIRSLSVQVEREREAKRAELQGRRGRSLRGAESIQTSRNWGGRTTLSRHQQREAAERSSSDDGSG